MVKGETILAGGAAVTAGRAYTCFHSSIPNQNGVVRICPVGQTTVNAMLTALGFSGGTAAATNVALRASGVQVGTLDSGSDEVFGV